MTTFALFDWFAPPGESSPGLVATDAQYPEEDCGVVYSPVVELEEVNVESGEENEDCMFEHHCRLYRFDEDQWYANSPVVMRMVSGF